MVRYVYIHPECSRLTSSTEQEEGLTAFLFFFAHTTLLPPPQLQGDSLSRVSFRVSKGCVLGSIVYRGWGCRIVLSPIEEVLYGILFAPIEEVLCRILFAPIEEVLCRILFAPIEEVLCRILFAPIEEVLYGILFAPIEEVLYGTPTLRVKTCTTIYTTKSRTK